MDVLEFGKGILNSGWSVIRIGIFEPSLVFTPPVVAMALGLILPLMLGRKVVTLPYSGKSAGGRFILHFIIVPVLAWVFISIASRGGQWDFGPIDTMNCSAEGNLKQFSQLASFSLFPAVAFFVSYVLMLNNITRLPLVCNFVGVLTATALQIGLLSIYMSLPGITGCMKESFLGMVYLRHAWIIIESLFCLVVIGNTFFMRKEILKLNVA